MDMMNGNTDMRTMRYECYNEHSAFAMRAYDAANAIRHSRIRTIEKVVNVLCNHLRIILISIVLAAGCKSSDIGVDLVK